MPRSLGRHVLALVLIVGSQLPALTAPPPARAAGLTIARHAGADRYATAAALSRATFAAPAAVAFVATGSAFPDALSAGPYAAKLHAPILLTLPAALPAVTKAELQRLQPAEIVVLGGPGAVSEGVVTELKALTGGPLTRIAGTDRYATAAAVSAHAFPDGAAVVHVATGANYPDALSGGVAAAVGGGPLLLVAPGKIPASVDLELRRLAPERIVVLGGTGAVSAALATQLKAYASSGDVTRIGGADRYATSALVSRATFATGAAAIYVATGRNFPDALAGAAVAGHVKAPLLLVPGDHAGSAALTEAKRMRPASLALLGASPLVSERVTLELRIGLGDLGALPACRYDDVATQHAGYDKWPITLLDTIYRLSSTYRPADLIDSSKAGMSSNHPFRSLVLTDMLKMRDAAAAGGRPIDIQSAFRSYATQQATFDYWVQQVGYTEALRTSARAGHSEHQLGTGFDFMSKGTPDPWDRGDWAATPAGAWMKANAWRYGFVMSYPKGAFAVVCYDYEPWHYRYYGRAQAAAMRSSALLPREYLWLHADGKPA
jgi:LAS superfamily LD-carboxypeptidase LdcB/putative cell wall-binding protein